MPNILYTNFKSIELWHVFKVTECKCLHLHNDIIKIWRVKLSVWSVKKHQIDRWQWSIVKALIIIMCVNDQLPWIFFIGLSQCYDFLNIPQDDINLQQKTEH